MQDPTLLAPDSESLADAATSWRCAYVHIPFCRRRCPYCDFAVVAYDEIDGSRQGIIEAYVEAVVAEISMEPTWAPLDAVNFGGGTPSTLSDSQLAQILDALHHRLGMASDAEVSLEANPEDITPGAARTFAALGFNRVSLGVQSLDTDVLGVLGRGHDPATVRRAVDHLVDAGIASLSLDLIYGAAGETLESWQATVGAAIDLEPEHLSAYGLTVEPGTELWRASRSGGPVPDPDHQADEYVVLQDAMQATPLVQYEVSNWAAPGKVCRYNLATWAQGEYAGFGLGAHGHRHGVRRRNVRSLDTYMRRVGSGERATAGEETQSEFSAELERLMLGIRRRAGVTLGRVGEAWLASPEAIRMLAAGIVAVRGDRLVVQQPLLTDAVARSVLSLSRGDC